MSTKWSVWCPYYGQEEDGTVIETDWAEDAAAEWAQRFDEQGDYTIISGSDVEVLVRREGSADEPQRFEVHGESVPHYSANKLPDAPKAAKPETERMFYVLSLKWTKSSDRVVTWWGPDSGGYVFRLESAGRYPESVIAAHPGHYNNNVDKGIGTKAILCEVAEALAVPVGTVVSRAIERSRPETDRVVEYRKLRTLKAWRDPAAKGAAA